MSASVLPDGAGSMTWFANDQVRPVNARFRRTARGHWIYVRRGWDRFGDNRLAIAYVVARKVTWITVPRHARRISL
jgi:hypothetical protein